MADDVLFSIARGNKADLDTAPIENGQLKVCKDSGELYADIDNERIQVSGKLPENTVVSGTSTGNIATPAPRDADTLEGHNAAYFATKDEMPIFQYDTSGKIIGYKTKIGGDTVFPF